LKTVFKRVLPVKRPFIANVSRSRLDFLHEMMLHSNVLFPKFKLLGGFFTKTFKQPSLFPALGIDRQVFSSRGKFVVDLTQCLHRPPSCKWMDSRPLLRLRDGYE
jgi:hypothetical protein